MYPIPCPEGARCAVSGCWNAHSQEGGIGERRGGEAEELGLIRVLAKSSVAGDGMSGSGILKLGLHYGFKNGDSYEPSYLEPKTNPNPDRMEYPTKQQKNLIQVLKKQ